MEQESAINAIVELVQEVGIGYFRQQVQEELEDMKFVLTQTTLHEKDEELAKRKEREEVGNRDYENLKRKYAALQEIFIQEEARRLAAVKSHEDEMQQRRTMEGEISYVVNKYERASEQISWLEERICALEHENNCMKDSICKLNSSVCFLEQEKNYWWHDACFVRRHAATLQQQLDASYDSLQFKNQEIKQLRKDIEDIHQMQEISKDTPEQPVLLQKLIDELQKCRQTMENLSVVVEDFKADKNITSQAEQLVELQHQFQSLQLEFQISEDEALAMKKTNEQQKKVIGELKDCLTDVNIELFESKLLQKKMKNIIKRFQVKENEVV